MSRIMTIWLPRWPVQRVLQQQPECRSRPIVLCRQNHRGLLTVTSWGWATPPAETPDRQPRIRPGMSLAEAMAVLAASSGPQACRLAHVVDEDCVGDQQALETLARWCRRFSPVVALGPAIGTAGSDSLHLDVTGTAHFFWRRVSARSHGPLDAGCSWPVCPGCHCRHPNGRLGGGSLSRAGAACQSGSDWRTAGACGRGSMVAGGIAGSGGWWCHRGSSGSSWAVCRWQRCGLRLMPARPWPRWG